jgi:hypothetical protein
MIPALSPITLRRDAFDPLGHLGGGTPRKRHQQDAARVGALDDQMGDPMGEGVGLSGSGSGNDQQRRAASPPAAPCSTARRCSGLRVSR